MKALNLRSFRQQNLLVEFASLKHVQLRGVYVSLTPGDPTVWTGVLFIRRGPYAPAIFRFRIAFPSSYPFAPPVITFTADLFHPLLTPLTTYTYTGTAELESSSVNVEDRLPAGAFSLRHGFPRWHKGFAEGSPGASSDFDSSRSDEAASEDSTIVDVLRYMRACFEEEEVLDQIPFGAAGNPGAWYAWQTRRGRKSEGRRPKVDEEHAVREDESEAPKSDPPLASVSPPANAPQVKRPRRPSQWNWEGVWEERVKRAVQSSLSEPMLFGNAGNREDEIHFVNADSDDIEALKAQMRLYSQVGET